MIRVAWLSVAPVKGLALEERDEVALEPYGVADNRRFFMLDEDGRRYGLLRDGLLVRVRPSYDPARERLALQFPDGVVVDGDVELGEEVTAEFTGRVVTGRVVNGAFAEALSAYVGRSLTLVKSDRPGEAVDRSLGPVSLVSRASLEELARRSGRDAVDARRFRMLIGVEGCAPHEEDEWLGRRVRVGRAVLQLHEQVARCAITTQNPDTGERDFDTLRAIKDYRGLRDGEGIDFGVYGEVSEPGPVRVGDPVEPV